MRYSPTPHDRRAGRLMWAFLLAGAVCFCLTPAFLRGRAAFQLGAVALMSCGVYVAVRYMLTSFVYEITFKNSAAPDGLAPAWEGGAPDIRLLPPSALDFVVRKASGRRAAVMDACLALEDLRYFAPLPREGGREREPYKLYHDLRVYNYTASVVPERQYMAVFIDAAENETGLVLEPSEEMAAFLSDIAARNAADRQLREEE